MKFGERRLMNASNIQTNAIQNYFNMHEDNFQYTYIISAFVQLTWNYAAGMCRQFSTIESSKNIKFVENNDEIFDSSNSK